MRKHFGITARLTSTYAVGNLASRGVQAALYLLFYATYLPVDEFGVLALIGVTIALLVLLIESPIVTGALERHYYHPAFRERNGQLLFSLLLFLMAVTAVLTGLYLAATKPLCRLFFSPNDLHLLRLYAIVLALWPLWSFSLSVLKLRERARYYVLTNLTAAVVQGSVTLYLLIGRHWGLYAVAWGHVAMLATAVALSAPAVLAAATFRPSLSILRIPLRYGYPLLVYGGAKMVVQVGDRYVLRLFRNFGELGLYQFGYLIAEAVDSVVVNPLLDGVAPTIRKLEANPPEQRRFIRQAATLYYAVAMAVGLALTLFSTDLIRLLIQSISINPAFYEARIIIPVLVFAFVIQALGVFLDWGMVMADRSGTISGTTIFAAAANLGLNFLLVPPFGFVGAAVAMLVSTVIWNALRLHFSRRFYGLQLEFGRLGLITAMGVALYGISLASIGWPLAVRIAFKTILAVAFPVLCYRTGVLNASQRRWLRVLLAKWFTFRRGEADVRDRG